MPKFMEQSSCKNGSYKRSTESSGARQNPLRTLLIVSTLLMREIIIPIMQHSNQLDLRHSWVSLTLFVVNSLT